MAFIWLGISIAVAIVLWTNKDKVIALLKKLDTPKQSAPIVPAPVEVKPVESKPVEVKPDPAPLPGQFSDLVLREIGGRGGNASPGTSLAGYDPRVEIKDGNVLDASGKFRTPNGPKTFSCPVKHGNYFIDGAECWGGLTIVVKHANGDLIGKASGGTPQVAWKQDVEETLIVETNYAGTNTDAGIKLHPSA